MRCGKPVLKDGQMCTKTDGQPWPCREEGEAAGSIEVDGLIVRIGDNYGTPVMALKDPYAPSRSYPAGVCDTTGVRRYAITCICATYADNWGVCADWERGGNGRCVFCDHEKACHSKRRPATATCG